MNTDNVKSFDGLLFAIDILFNNCRLEYIEDQGLKYIENQRPSIILNIKDLQIYWHQRFRYISKLMANLVNKSLSCL